DFEHKSRNRMKFMIKAMGWDTWRGHYEEALAQVRSEGGVRAPFDPASVPEETAPDWTPAEAPTLQKVAAMAMTPVTGPGIVPGTVKLTTLPDAYVRWMKANVHLQRQPGYCYVLVRLPLGDFTA